MKPVPSKYLILFFALLLLGCSLFLFLRSRAGAGCIARIYKSEELLYEIDLSEVRESYTIDLGGNVVLVEQGRISMLEADCPDKLCVHTGAIFSAAYPVVCLPNEVVISIESDGAAPDAVLGR